MIAEESIQKKRICYCCFLLLLFFSFVNAEESSSLKIKLDEAFKKFSSSSFSCDYNNIPLLRQLEAHSGKYYQFSAKDGFVFQKLILKNSAADDLMIFLKNRKGSFFCYDGKWHQCLDLLPLWYFENMMDGFSDSELALCRLSSKKVTLKGMDYEQIVMNTIQDADKLRQLHYLFPLSILEDTDNLDSPFYQNRPMKRVFLLGCNDGFLYSRIHYNRCNKIVFKRVVQGKQPLPSNMNEAFFEEGVVEGKINNYFLETFVPLQQKRMKSIGANKKAKYVKFEYFYIVLFVFILMDIGVAVYLKCLKK